MTTSHENQDFFKRYSSELDLSLHVTLSQSCSNVGYGIQSNVTIEKSYSCPLTFASFHFLV